MNKKLIRLTESDLHRIVKESVRRIIAEDDNVGDDVRMAVSKAAQDAANAATAATAPSISYGPAHKHKSVEETPWTPEKQKAADKALRKWRADLEKSTKEMIDNMVKAAEAAVQWGS